MHAVAGDTMLNTCACDKDYYGQFCQYALPTATSTPTTTALPNITVTPSPTTPPNVQVGSWYCFYAGNNAYVPINFASDGNVQCMAQNAINCLWTGSSLQQCIATVGSATNLRPLVCGAKYAQVYGDNGYDTIGSWCRDGRDYLNSLRPSTTPVITSTVTPTTTFAPTTTARPVTTTTLPTTTTTAAPTVYDPCVISTNKGVINLRALAKS